MASEVGTRAVRDLRALVAAARGVIAERLACSLVIFDDVLRWRARARMRFHDEERDEVARPTKSSRRKTTQATRYPWRRMHLAGKNNTLGLHDKRQTTIKRESQS